MTNKIEDGESTRDTYIRLYGADAVQRANDKDHTFTPLSDREDGGHAFPVLHSIDGNWNREPISKYSGMSLRDWFAGMALQGILAGLFSDKYQRAQLDECTKAAYQYADFMIIERMKK